MKTETGREAEREKSTGDCVEVVEEREKKADLEVIWNGRESREKKETKPDRGKADDVARPQMDDVGR